MNIPSYNNIFNVNVMGNIKDIAGHDSVLQDVLLSKFTTFRIGGVCKCLVIIKRIENLIKLLNFLNDNQLSYKILGNGSNLLIDDMGIQKEVVIKISIQDINLSDDTIKCSSGVTLPYLASLAFKNSLSGLEFGCGIPASIGGAVIMNAGAYGRCMADCIVQSEIIDERGNIKILNAKSHEFGYRYSIFHRTPNIIIVSSTLKLNLKDGRDCEEIGEVMNLYKNKRRLTQPYEFPSAGSIFRHPKNHLAGKLIEDCNLKGYKIGGAQISKKHAGFIINTGDATCKNVLDLIEFVKNTVLKEYGIELKEEIKYWNF